MNRVALLLAAALCGCASVDLSFKAVGFRGVAAESVHALLKEVIAAHFQGLVIRADPASGRIETDFVEFHTRKGLRREQVLARVERGDGGTVRVELMAPMAEMVVDATAAAPVAWRVLGSDVRVERSLLEELAGRVQLEYPDSVLLAR